MTYLKIKDEVNLDILKKFGFEVTYSNDEIEEYSRCKFIDRGYGRATFQLIKINPVDRIVRFYNMGGETHDKKWANDLRDVGIAELWIR